jgi:hypothetical protein
MPLEPQRAAQALSDHAIVFDEQEAHAGIGDRNAAQDTTPSRYRVGHDRDRAPMTARLRHTPLSFRDALATAGPFALIAVAGLALAYWMLDPQPPRRVVLATGQAQGAYAEFGERYRKLLAENGITVDLRETAGSAENLKLLADPHSGVDLAFVQGGSADASTATEEDDDDPLLSLGSLFYEPVWLFYRRDGAAASRTSCRDCSMRTASTRHRSSSSASRRHLRSSSWSRAASTRSCSSRRRNR